jgi:hypothetical protein
MANFEDEINKIDSKDDFINFIELLTQNLRTNPEEWENKTLPDYLSAISSWTEDMDGYYQNKGLPVPKNVDWKVFASTLIAAKIYE